MRIVGGSLRGRRLATPSDDAIRPTTDRNRESLFNVLMHHHPEKVSEGRVLDLFCGTGALGLEAISRGAAFAMFVDDGAQARGLVRTNVEAFGLTGTTRILRRDATRLGTAIVPPFGLVFADPPYGKELGERAVTAALDGGWLEEGALLVLEEASASLPTALPGFALLDRRASGTTATGIFRRI
ncbi:16S rRNA (guanine(966)-N(2))-methyltransferase RsmD [Rhizobiaceae bacterium]|nr:16S rRNA (guanine(966)-N(2))-methyltransferase RsmD [Rhizobiaceae bacterium]